MFDCQFHGKTYHLCEGCWYEINANFISRLQAYLDPIFLDTHDILRECNEKREDDYNKKVAENPHIGLDVCCLDKTSIAPKGQRVVEPCDLIVNREYSVEMIHNKISTCSASLSHLFNQGVNSVMLLQESKEAQDNLKELVGGNDTMKGNIDNGKYTITFGIVSNKSRDQRSQALPLFSRISLLRSVKTLSLMRIPVKVFLIKDNVDRIQ